MGEGEDIWVGRTKGQENNPLYTETVEYSPEARNILIYFILFYYYYFLVCLLSRKAVVLEYIRYLQGYNAYTQIGIAAINKCKNLPSAIYMHLLSTESQ